MQSVAKVLASVFGVAVLAALARGQCFSFQPACPGLNGAVKTMCSWDPDGAGPLAARLVAGGSFTENGQGSHDYIASWNGSAWDGLGWGTSGTVNAVSTWDPDGDGPLPARLVIGGDFLYVGADSTGQLTANHIAMWDGEAWRPLGTGADGNVQALTTWDPDGAGPLPPVLVAAGEFQNIGGTRVDFVATWDGTAWQNLGYGLSGPAKALATWDPDGTGPLGEQLVVGGTFLQAGAASTGAITVNNVAAWDGDVWHAFGQGLPGTPVRCLASVPAASGAPTLVTGTNFVKYWTGADWVRFETADGISDLLDPQSMFVFDFDGPGPNPARLLAAGEFEYWSIFCDYSNPKDPYCYWEYGPAPMLAVWSDRWTDMTLDEFDGSFAPSFGVVGGTLFAGEAVAPYVHEYGLQPSLYFVEQPTGGPTHRGGSITMTAAADHYALYHWWYRTDGPPYEAWTRLADGGFNGYSVVSGSRTSTLTITNLASNVFQHSSGGPYDTAAFRCEISNDCGPVYSDAAVFRVSRCTSNFDHQGGAGTDADIEAFFSCLAGSCCPTCDGPDFNGDGDVGTDGDIEAFFRVLGGGSC